MTQMHSPVSNFRVWLVGHPECVGTNRHVVGMKKPYRKGEKRIHPGLDVQDTEEWCNGFFYASYFDKSLGFASGVSELELRKDPRGIVQILLSQFH